MMVPAVHTIPQPPPQSTTRLLMAVVVTRVALRIDKYSRHTRYGYTCITLIVTICPVTYKNAFVEIPVEYRLL